MSTNTSEVEVKNKCKLCNSNSYRIVYKASNFSDKFIDGKKYSITNLETKPSFEIVECQRCRLVYVSECLDSKVILSSYEKSSDDLYLKEETGRRVTARRLLKKIRKLKRGGRLLDIGCATGFLLDEARRMNYEVQGIEMSEWAVRFATQKLNLPVLKGSISDADFPGNYFDVVIMTDVIEHFLDPLDVLVKIRKILKPNGVLCVTTPDITSFASRILKAKWWGIKNSHLVYFSRKTMAKMLDRAGFKVITTRSHARTFSLHYWADRLSFYKSFWSESLKALLRILGENRLITLNLHDQLEFFIHKKRALQYLDQDEQMIRPIPRENMKTIVVLPARNSEKTIAYTVRDIPREEINEIILVDDGSEDGTVQVSEALGLKVFRSEKQKEGYGACQKTCYKKALEMGADIVVMLHPGYQYDPKVIPELIQPIKDGIADAVFGSRMMKGGSLEGGMPVWKHNANITLTAFQNIVLKTYLSEYHSGFRAYSARLLKSIQFEKNNDGCIFDTEVIVQSMLHNFRIEEIPIRTRYFDEAAPIGFGGSLAYGFGVIKTMLKYLIHENNLIRFEQFE